MVIEVLDGIVSGIVLLPETVLTKICIVSSDSEQDEVMLEMLEVRRIVETGRAGVAVLRWRVAGGGGDGAGKAWSGRGR